MNENMSFRSKRIQNIMGCFTKNQQLKYQKANLSRLNCRFASKSQTTSSEWHWSMVGTRRNCWWYHGYFFWFGSTTVSETPKYYCDWYRWEPISLRNKNTAINLPLNHVTGASTVLNTASIKPLKTLLSPSSATIFREKLWKL